MLNANSYAAPKHTAPCVAATTMGPGPFTNLAHPSVGSIELSSAVIANALPRGPRPGTASKSIGVPPMPPLEDALRELLTR